MSQTKTLIRATVEFETYSKDEIPLKPIFISLRDCTTDGTPLE